MLLFSSYRRHPLALRLARFTASLGPPTRDTDGPVRDPLRTDKVVEEDRHKQVRGAFEEYMQKKQSAQADPTSLFSRLQKSHSEMPQKKGFNTRLGPMKSQAGGRARQSSRGQTFPSSNDPDLVVASSNVRGRKTKSRRNLRAKGDRDSERGRKADRKLDAIDVALGQWDSIVAAAQSGKVFNTEDMDEFDQFLGDILIEAAKSPSGEVRTIIKSPSFNRIQIPEPRPMKQLLASMHPNIYTAEVGSDGYLLGAQAWEVISKNPYYSDADRDFMANAIARLSNEVLGEVHPTLQEFADDEIFHSEFRKGLPGIKREQAREKARQMKEGTVVEEMVQGETDWDTEAVVDEDELFLAENDENDDDGNADDLEYEDDDESEDDVELNDDDLRGGNNKKKK